MSRTGVWSSTLSPAPVLGPPAAPSPAPSPTDSGLRRALGLPLLVLYGLGTIIGAGIYVLIGKVAGYAGLYAPVAFVLAAALATLTAISYAALSARLPRSAGEAAYVEAAFARVWLVRLVGFGVILTGCVSAAAIANGFVGYLHVYADVPDALAIGMLIGGLGAIAYWGIGQSVGFAAALTLIEIGGLVFVVAVAGDSLSALPARWPELVPGLDGPIWFGILLGVVLAFYAFIGFEDIVNVAEETRSPEKNLPRAIYISLAVSTLLYCTIALTAVLALPPAVLSASEAPLAAVVQSKGYDPRWTIAGASLLAVTNGALIQIIMASRVLYGLACQGHAPRALGRVSPSRRTPAVATACVTALVLSLALWLPLESLARWSSLITLSVFAAVNGSVLALARPGRLLAGVGIGTRLAALAGLLGSTLLALWQLSVLHSEPSRAG